ncbi:DUF1566 domain-containing protein [bacterium]|nr:DUF1566 domain-containing protein [bacterium]
MKKSIFIVLILLIFFIGCKDSNGEKIPENEGKIDGVCYPNKTCDKGLVCDEDKNICINDKQNDEDIEQKTEENDSDIEFEDNDEEISDDPCKPNPCTTDEHSTGECVDKPSSKLKYICKCSEGYFWNKEKCKKLPECSPTSGNPCIDSTIGYIWSSKSKNKTSQDQAVIEYCPALSEGEYTDWRLPTISELRTLIQHCPTLETGGSCEVTDLCTGYDCLTGGCTTCPTESDGRYSKLGDADMLWSSTSRGGAWDTFWYMDFGNPGPLWAYVTVSMDIRCIRSDWNPCKPNQCKYIKNSTGQCVVLDRESYYCQCYSDYIWHVSANACEPRENYFRVADCTGLPKNAQWNTVSRIEQSFDGSEWKPSSEGVYNEEGSQSECRFVCESGYFWIDSECKPDPNLPECSPTSDTPCIDSTTGYIWSEAQSGTRYSAIQSCPRSHDGGFNNWHLPTIDELRTLILNCDGTISGGECKVSENCIELSCSDETCNSCPETQDGGYSKFGDTGRFISSSVAENLSTINGQGIWYVDFSTGSIKNLDSFIESFRCVK